MKFRAYFIACSIIAALVGNNNSHAGQSSINTTERYYRNYGLTFNPFITPRNHLKDKYRNLYHQDHPYHVPLSEWKPKPEVDMTLRKDSKLAGIDIPVPVTVTTRDLPIDTCLRLTAPDDVINLVEITLPDGKCVTLPCTLDPVADALPDEFEIMVRFKGVPQQATRVTLKMYYVLGGEILNKERPVKVTINFFAVGINANYLPDEDLYGLYLSVYPRDSYMHFRGSEKLGYTRFTISPDTVLWDRNDKKQKFRWNDRPLRSTAFTVYAEITDTSQTPIVAEITYRPKFDAAITAKSSIDVLAPFSASINTPNMIANLDSNDADGIVDYADGFNLLGQNGDDLACQDESYSAQVTLQLPAGALPSRSTLSVDYSDSIPMLPPLGDIQTCMNSNSGYSILRGHLRIWVPSMNAARNCNPVSQDGDFLEANVPVRLEKLNLNGGKIVLNVEAVRAFQDQKITFHLDLHPKSNEDALHVFTLDSLNASEPAVKLATPIYDNIDYWLSNKKYPLNIQLTNLERSNEGIITIKLIDDGNLGVNLYRKHIDDATMERVLWDNNREHKWILSQAKLNKYQYYIEPLSPSSQEEETIQVQVAYTNSRNQTGPSLITKPKPVISLQLEMPKYCHTDRPCPINLRVAPHWLNNCNLELNLPHRADYCQLQDNANKSIIPDMGTRARYSFPLEDIRLDESGYRTKSISVLYPDVLTNPKPFHLVLRTNRGHTIADRIKTIQPVEVRLSTDTEVVQIGRPIEISISLEPPGIIPGSILNLNLAQTNNGRVSISQNGTILPPIGKTWFFKDYSSFNRNRKITVIGKVLSAKTSDIGIGLAWLPDGRNTQPISQTLALTVTEAPLPSSFLANVADRATTLELAAFQNLTEGILSLETLQDSAHSGHNRIRLFRDAGLTDEITYTDILTWKLANRSLPGKLYIPTPASTILYPHKLNLSVAQNNGSATLQRIIKIAPTSPGSLELAPNLRITEIMYNPHEINADTSECRWKDNNEFEYIELCNIGTEPVYMDRVKLEGDISFQFFDKIPFLWPNRCILLAKNIEALKARYGDEIGYRIAGEYSGNLLNEGIIRIIDASGDMVSNIAYKDSWHPQTNGRGHSLELAVLDGNMAIQNAWRASENIDGYGSPGKTHIRESLHDNLRITEVMYKAIDGDEFDFIELCNIGGTTLDISRLRIQGDISFSFSNATVSSVDPGAFLLIISNSSVTRFKETYNGEVPIFIAGSYKGELGNHDGKIALINVGRTIADLRYFDRAKAGHSLVPADPRTNSPRTHYIGQKRWYAHIHMCSSWLPGGSPGREEGNKPKPSYVGGTLKVKVNRYATGRFPNGRIISTITFDNPDYRTTQVDTSIPIQLYWGEPAPTVTWESGDSDPDDSWYCSKNIMLWSKTIEVKHHLGGKLQDLLTKRYKQALTGQEKKFQIALKLSGRFKDGVPFSTSTILNTLDLIANPQTLLNKKAGTVSPSEGP